MRYLRRWVDRWFAARQAARPVTDQDLTYWRERVLDVALLVGGVAGTLSVIPGIIRPIAEGSWYLLVANVAMLVVALPVLFSRRISARTRGGVLVVLSLVIGMAQLYTSGIHSTGPLWLFAAPVLAAILLGLRHALALVGGTALVLLAYWIAAPAGVPTPEIAAEIRTPRWTETAVDLVLLAGITTLFIGVLLQGLRTSFDRLQKLSRALEEERERLIQTNSDLELEVSRRRQAEAERRALEHQLRQSQKMQAIGTFAGGIAHDFNNLLVPILASAEMLRSEVDGASREHVSDIARSAERARDLVGQILAFSRGGASEAKPVRLDRILEETDRLLRASLPARIRLLYEIRDHGPVLWSGAEAQQVVLNLANNAFHAMGEEGGELRIGLDTAVGGDVETRRGVATGNVDAGTEYVRLTVRDSGRGMEPETLHRIFEPFFTTRDAGEGTGLGLAMVHGLVNSAGGVLLADSEPGQGAHLQVLLPRLSPDAVVESPASVEAAAGAGQKVLVVDDEEPVARVTARLLERLGYRPVMTTDPDEGLRRLGAEPDIDLLFSDYSMPAATGIELGRRARELRPDLAMILCSGLVEEATRDEATIIGFDTVLSKPFGRDQLAEAVERALAPGEDAGEEGVVVERPGVAATVGSGPG